MWLEIIFNSVVLVVAFLVVSRAIRVTASNSKIKSGLSDLAIMGAITIGFIVNVGVVFVATEYLTNIGFLTVTVDDFYSANLWDQIIEISFVIAMPMLCLILGILAIMLVFTVIGLSLVLVGLILMIPTTIYYWVMSIVIQMKWKKVMKNANNRKRK